MHACLKYFEKLDTCNYRDKMNWTNEDVSKWNITCGRPPCTQTWRWFVRRRLSDLPWPSTLKLTSCSVRKDGHMWCVSVLKPFTTVIMWSNWFVLLTFGALSHLEVYQLLEKDKGFLRSYILLNVYTYVLKMNSFAHKKALFSQWPLQWPFVTAVQKGLFQMAYCSVTLRARQPLMLYKSVKKWNRNDRN